MPILRPYADRDHEAVVDLCLRAFTPACESLEELVGAELDWRKCIAAHVRSLTRSGERKRLVVAEIDGSLAGFVHYQVDRARQSGSIGISAVHPARQGGGIGRLMHAHVLDAMRSQGVKYVTAETAGDASQAAARRVYEQLGFVAVPTVHWFMTLGDPGRGPDGARAEARRVRRPSAVRSKRRR